VWSTFNTGGLNIFKTGYVSLV